MARLNEAPAAADALETLRRKFLRQNRDIARDNSARSLRIRNLENEVSRLLAENLAYRQQVAHLENEVSTSKNRRIIDHVNTTKSQLEVKMDEMMALVKELKHVPAARRRISLEPRKAEATRSPRQKEQREMWAMSETIANQEGRLPAILENKQYPRRTMDQAEILQVIQDDPLIHTDSSDIGPPPVSHCVNEDPIKVDTSAKEERPVNNELEPTLSVNLEQRRKRRESSGTLDSKRTGRFENSTTPVPAGSSLLKTGAKRKLSVRDDDEPSTTTKEIEVSPDDFKFVRKSSEDKSSAKHATQSDSSTTGSKAARELASARGIQREKKPASTSSIPPRRALGSKSANVDVANSPKKNTGLKAAGRDGNAAAKDDPKETTKVGARSRRSDYVPIKPVALPTLQTVEFPPSETDLDAEPETPAALADLLSPTDSAPSTAREESRDTPPPPDLGPGMEGHRPSRRARAAVSYAEPNLRDKMRRPTKELVDAVTGEGKSNRTSFIMLENDLPGTDIKVKSEAEVDNAWKTMPAASAVDVYSKSPLGIKTGAAGFNSDSLRESRNRKVSTLQLVGDRGSLKSGSSSTISALISGTKVKQEPRASDAVDHGLEKAMSKLDIFEFDENSPERQTARVKAMKVPRKMSSAPQESGQISDGGSSDTERKIKPLSSSRRRQSALGLESSLYSSENGVRRSTSSASIAEGASESVPGSRGERAAGRRRSMML